MKVILELFFVFFKLGLFTFGGGYAMIPHIKDVIVEKKKWMSEDDVIRIIAIAESTPGPIAINMATYIGYQRKKILGSIFATLGVVIPSFVIILIISYFFNRFIDNKYVAAAFVGIKCCVAFLIIKTGFEMLFKMERKPIFIILFFFVISILCLCQVFNLATPSIYLIIIGGLIGIVTCLVSEIRQNKKKAGNKS